MTGFDFDVNNELRSIRKKPGTGASKPADVKAPAEQPEPEESKPAPQAVAIDETPLPAAREIKQPEPEGFGINQSHQESNNGASAKPRRVSDPVDWKGFKPLKGVFDFVGGDRPVILREPVKRAQASGMPDGLIVAMQSQLKAKFQGATLEFPWGTYEIDDYNKVFTTRASLLRYLLFDGLRDGNGIQVQFAKQWLVLHQPLSFDADFSTEVLKSGSDELDIYALLMVAYLSEQPVQSGVKTERDFQASDQLNLVNANLSRLMEMVDNQSTTMSSFVDRNQTLQTVTLLDRMGLLKGGLPKDMGAFLRLLEQNRDAIESMSQTVDEHNAAEKERQRVLDREARMKAAYPRR